jgi:hypothetical protein
MVFKNICDLLGFGGGCFLMIYGIRMRRQIPQNTAWASLTLAGGCSVIWSILGEILLLSNITNTSCDLIKMFIGGIAVGVLLSMALSRQTNFLTIDLFRKNANPLSGNPKQQS